MADPQTPQTDDQGFLPGLLGKVRDIFGTDPQAAYGGLLSDEATRRAFAWRELGAAAGAFSQGAMPVPYKGGIPFGATLGAAGAAASTAGDSLIKARLEQAQQQQALANVGLSQQQVTLMQAALPGLKSLIATGQAGLGAGGSGVAGTGTSGTALTGPAKIIAGGGGSTVGGIGGPDNAEIKTNNFAGMRVPGAGPGGPNTNPAGWQTFATPADGVQAIGNQLDRYAAGKTTGQPLTTLRQMVSTWAPPSENDTDALIKRASTVTGLDPDAPVDLSNPAVRAKVTEAFIRNEQGGNLHPKAVEGLSAVYGNAWSPHGGQAQAAAAPAPATEPPMAPSAAPPGGLLKLPDPTSAAPPQLATPPAAGAPGPVTGLLGQQPAQQVAAADAPQLSPAAAAVLQGINRQQAGGGLLASGSVAGDNAVPTGGPSPAAVAQAGPPHTGAAGAAELAGLLAQQPAAAPPTATPYTSAPPVTGQGAPAPGPVSSPPAPSVPMRQGPAPIGPPPQLPPMPTQMPASGNLPNVQPTPQQMIAQGVSGLMSMSGHPAPGWIDDLAKMPAQMALEQFKAWVGAQTTMMTARDAEVVKATMAPYIAAAEAAARAQQEGVRPNRLFPQPDGTFRQAPGEPYHRAGPPDIYGNPTEVMVYPSGDPNVPEKVVPIPGTSGQGTYRTEEEKASAARDAALADRFTTQGVAANDIRPTISMAKSILANTPTGIGAPYQAALNEMLAKVSGNPALAEKTGNYQQLASQLAEVRRGMMQGEPQGDLKAIPGEFASVGTSPQALPRMLSDISGMADYRAARLQAMTQYADPKIHPENQGSTRGFASWWSQNFNPYAFMLNRMDPNERATALYRIAQQPGGHQEIDRIVAQDRLGRSWGYIPNFGPGQ